MAKKRIFLAISLVALFLADMPLHGEKDKSLEEAWGQLKSAEPHFSQGLKEFRESRYENASAAFQKCVQEMPRHAYAHYYLANLFYIRGEYQISLSHMEMALGHFNFMQELSDYAGKLKNKKIDSYQQMLTTEWDNNTDCRTRREIESFADQLSVDKAQVEILGKKQQNISVRQKAHYLYFAGNILFQLKRFSEASEKYREAIELNPGHVSAYNNAAAISYMAGDHRAALIYLERAEEQGLEDNLNLTLKQLVYEALGRPTEGILQEDLSLGAENDLGVMRFALAFRNEKDMLPPLYENCYVVYSRKSKEAVLIDPGVPDSRIADFIRKRNLEVRAILNTHGHEDHSGADKHFAGLFGAPVCAHKKDAGYFAVPPDRYLEDGETVSYDGFAVRVFHTPGHSPGGLCFSIGNFLFSGDTLFKNDIGKVWTKDANKIKKVRETLVRNIKEKLLVLPGQTRVCPGHGKTSTVADEKADNPFLKK
jgi:glyoxylase-like metal-dependent hydrolase (beta-lactamase superfamily II)/Tfp pilus assembly protein PilF